MTIKTETFTLPAFWAPALVNDDRTGMTEDDEYRLEGWLAQNPDMWCVSCGDTTQFMTYHDARCVGVLACDVMDYTFHTHEGE